MLPPFCHREEAETLDASLRGTSLAPALGALLEASDRACAPGVHGNLEKWRGALAALPAVTPSEVDWQAPAVRIGRASDLSDDDRATLKTCLEAFVPWRKGPFELFGIELDCEWRCDLKWERVRAACQPLTGRRVLDVGSGNGYYALRMLADAPRSVLALDPYLLYALQYRLLRHYLADESRLHLLPLPFEALPEQSRCFDTVFSMGVLYHRRSPMDHLLALRRALRDGGELVLETLVIEGGSLDVLVPEGRYASMRNVWFLPSPDALMSWLRKAGFRQARLADLTRTSTEEQRPTAWMPFRSLRDALDPSDPTRTVEGHPGPLRAVIVAQAG
ncbi:MAG: tRNA 5-methoxyuridine(34)/uridine 5-oxyacetic acid(34) synthase CmoB [Pseudomonadota bacterium]